MRTYQTKSCKDKEATPEKIYLDANTLLLDSFRLARKIWESGFVPDYLVALWRGGTPVGIAIHEFLRYKGVDPYHTAIKTQSYTGIMKRGPVEVKGLEHVIEIINSEDKMLLVDDVFDTGCTIREVLKHINEKARKNTPEIRVATIYYKPKRNKTSIIPDYYLHECDDWLVFPHELTCLTKDELKCKGLELYEILTAPKGQDCANHHRKRARK